MLRRSLTRFWWAPFSDKGPAPFEGVIGIDVGATTAKVAVMQDKKIEVITNEQGSRSTQVAPIRAGASTSTPPYDPLVFAEMKKIAEAYLGMTVRNAVLVVPSEFNDSQRQAVKRAGESAELKVLRLINEPTAAGIAHVHTLEEEDSNKVKVDERYVLVFDLGGSTFKATVLEYNYGVWEVLAAGGDPNLGGKDFDQRLLKHSLRSLDETKLLKFWHDPESIKQLTQACAKAKCELSTLTTTSVEFGSPLVKVEITRDTFDQLCDDLFNKTVQEVEAVLTMAAVKKSDIQDVIVVGGSGRVPGIQKRLSALFEGKEVTTGGTIPPEEAIVSGAAVMGDRLTGKVPGLVLMDEDSSGRDGFESTPPPPAQGADQKKE